LDQQAKPQDVLQTLLEELMLFDSAMMLTAVDEVELTTVRPCLVCIINLENDVRGHAETKKDE
jgi:hypothetical protein